MLYFHSLKPIMRAVNVGWISVLLALLVPGSLTVGWLSGHLFLGCAASAVVACMLALRVSIRSAGSRRREGRVATTTGVSSHGAAGSAWESSSSTAGPALDDGVSDDGEPDDAGDLVRKMVGQGRYALLLRPQIAGRLPHAAVERSLGRLEHQMALVPTGDVRMSSWRGDERRDDSARRIVRVDALYLDRHPVTNAQFQAFVAAGGYEQMPMWDSAVWPAVLDFVDTTGHPGPRYWRLGRFPDGLDDHPVVGVSWYEAWAYARWVGKRLVTDPEWVKSGSWPVATAADDLVQRKYPWGDTMQRDHVNIWGTGDDRTCSVDAFPEGGSVGGVYQLIGNVWEWTANNFGVWDADAQRVKRSPVMKSLRGGAFDTYFETQASCHFQSGDSPLARKHNIGFRCAISLCDIAPQVFESDDLDSLTDLTDPLSDSNHPTAGLRAGENE